MKINPIQIGGRKHFSALFALMRRTLMNTLGFGEGRLLGNLKPFKTGIFYRSILRISVAAGCLASPHYGWAQLSDTVRVSSVSVILGDQHTDNASHVIDQMGVLGPAMAVLGKSLNAVQINQLADALTAKSRQAGFMVSRILVTSEDLAQWAATGQLRLTAFPGRVGRISVQNNTKVDTKRLQLTLEATLCAQGGLNGKCEGDRPLTTAHLERATLNLQDLTDVVVKKIALSADKVGQGETHLAVTAEPSENTRQFSLGVDNWGAKSAGLNRLVVSGSVPNLLAMGDVFRATAIVSNSKLYSGDISLNAPIAYSGLHGYVGANKLNFSVPGVDTRGAADSIRLGVWYPLVRTRNDNLRAELGLSHANSHVESGNTTIYQTELNGYQLNLTGNNGDAAEQQVRSSYQWRVGVSSGHVGISDAVQRQFDTASANTYGRYDKATYGLALRYQFGVPLRAPFVALNVRGQNASKNLDGSEKLLLGGPTAVRAYPTDATSVDVGTISSLDFGVPFAVGGQRAVASVFYDEARGDLNRRPWQPGIANRVVRSGYGFALHYAPTKDSNLSLIWATPHESQVGGSKNQFWVSASIKY